MSHSSSKEQSPAALCKKPVSDHTGFHWYPCNKPAKFRVSVADGPAKPYCGVHANQFKGRPGAIVVPL